MRLTTSLFYKLILTVPVIGATVFVIATSWNDYASAARIIELNDGSLDPIEHAKSLLVRTEVDHPKEWIDTATKLTQNTSDHDFLAIDLLDRALEVYPQHPNGWALLAFLKARDTQSFSEPVAEALRMSNSQCRLCERDLLKWRLTFTLAHWDVADEDLRMSAFLGADYLRWWYLEYEFLNDVRAAATMNGIPFDEYRRKVDTPVRPNEVN